MLAYEQASIGDSESLRELFARTHADDMSAKVYRWKFVDNPHGPAVIWVARERASGPPVGALALMPRKCVSSGSEFIGGQLVDAMVDHAFRRRGIFSSLLDLALREYEARGLDFCFTFPAPTSMSFGAFEKLDAFEQIHSWNPYRKFWTGKTFAKRMVRSTTLANVVEPALRGWFALRDSLRVEALEVREGLYAWESPHSFVMDEAWMRWRTMAPGRTFRSIAWDGGGAILRMNVGTAALYHLQLGTHAASAMRAMLDYCKGLPLDALYFEAFVDQACEALLRRAGFLTHGHSSCRLFIATRNERVRSELRRADFSSFRADVDVP